MYDYINDDIFKIEELAVLIAAATKIGKLDERILNSSSPDTFYFAPILRDCAISIASLEGELVRTESLCRLLGNREITNIDRSVRLAADIYDALYIMCKLNDKVPSEKQIRKIFATSEKSSGRVMKQELIWNLEEDCQWLCEELSSLFETPSAHAAITAINEIWSSGRFLGSNRRIAMIMSGWILSKGFNCASPILGLPIYISKEIDEFREASSNAKTWITMISQSLRELGDDGINKINNGAASKLSMLTLCPPLKTTSSIENAIDFIMVSPVFTAKLIGEALQLTPRGTKIILDKLEEAEIIEAEGGRMNRNFVCRRAM